MPLNAILRLARTGIRIMPTNWHRTPPPNRKTSVGTREEVESVPSGTGFPGVGRKIALGTSRMALTKGVHIATPCTGSQGIPIRETPGEGVPFRSSPLLAGKWPLLSPKWV